ncbi:MAG: 3-deoxy-manno-octulosonate-8-phosphatase KdsC [Gammaproteobacteria bacterium]|jgi:3-deoxy-D-manno-octulosonate 8-phosphate phosphatase (KDO 8-P phosphatase)|nr:3-deoxy-manno-octulosonate-8-phosphatase KdsC [Gammaproteobacteria bacterium]
MEQIKAKAAKIKLVIFDVDGVLTNGSLFYGDDGQEYKAFHSRDGHGMKMLQKSGVDIAFITGRTSDVVSHRAKNLGIEHVYQGQLQKLPAFKTLLEKLNLLPEEVAYVGDDVVDLPVMIRVGLAITVDDGHELAKKHAHWITQHRGGQGAAREICEFIMQAQGTWDTLIRDYIS